MATAKTLGFVLFDQFELLDVFGPAEAFGIRDLDGAFRLVMVAEKSGPVASAQGPRTVADYGFDDCPHLDMFLVPGGMGTRREVENPVLLRWLWERAAKAELVMSVCTGSALLARAGLLDGIRATSNKRALDWVVSQGPAVKWNRTGAMGGGRQVRASSGVSAGIDMALAIIARMLGTEAAEKNAIGMEYEWHRDAAWDPFAKIWGRA
jgi:putative intracellular protease/amidase